MMKCPNCAFDIPLDMHYCGKCGTYLKRVCENCGYANPLNYDFCGMCGVSLGDASFPKSADPFLSQGSTQSVSEPYLAPSIQHPVSSAPQPVTTVQPLIQGERRVATIILADVQGSTDLLEYLGTEAWVEMMNRVFQALEAEIYRFGGKVDQFRGDGLVAFFGATSAHEDDPERAVLAALAMQQAVKRYAAELAESTDIDLRLRVGVNTGEVIVTSVGNRTQYSEDTAMGEAIAIAARMETSAEAGTVLVSESTYLLVQANFEWEALGEIKVKGVSEPITVYRPLLPRAYAHSSHSYGLSVPLIGREDAFEMLKDSVDALYAGRGGIIMISGERGIGKSFLMSEVRHHFARQGVLLSLIAEGSDEVDASAVPVPLTWLRERCRSYDQSRPFSVWNDLLYSWLGSNPNDSPEDIERRLRQQLKTVWLHNVHVIHYPYLASFLDLPLDPSIADQLAQLDGETWRQRFFGAIRAWLEGLSHQGPLVVSLSDMQWADMASLALLESCMSLCDTQALLWLLVFRPMRGQPIWAFHHHVQTEYPHRASMLLLPALDEAQSRMLIERLIGANVLSSQTEALILEKAEGNPYFIQELIHTLIVKEDLVQDAQTGEWRATQDVTHLDLPDSLQNLLMARIDRLSPDEKRLLQMAAVIGPVFWSNALQALVGEDFPLQKHLTALQRLRLIRDRWRVSRMGMEYIFSSALIRDVAYEGLLRVQRVAYHKVVAEYLGAFCEDDERVVSFNFVAHHHHQAGNLAQEVVYLLKAAKHFRKIYANAEALEQYNRVLSLLDTLDSQATTDEERRIYLTQRFQAQDERRELYFLAGRFKEGWEDAEALLPLARQLEGEPVWLIDALLRQPGVSYWRSREEQMNGIVLTEEALALSRKMGDPHREMRTLRYITGQRYNLGDPSWQDIADQVLELARELGDRRYEVGLLIGIGGVYAAEDPELSMHYLEMALPITQNLNDPQLELDVLDVMGRQLESSVDYYHRLKAYYEKALRISREISNRPAESQALLYGGQLRALFLGDYEVGLSMLEQGREIVSGTPGEIYFLLRVAQIYIEQGRYTDAEVCLAQSECVITSADKTLAQIGTGLVNMLLYNAQQEQVLLQKALDISASISQMSAEQMAVSSVFYQQYQMVLACETAATYLNLAQITEDEATKQTYVAQALTFSQTALQSYETFGFVRPIECTSEKILFYHSKVLAATGQQVVALEYLTRAYEEMMRKHALIPVDSHFRRTYLQNISLHRAIRVAYTAEIPADFAAETTL